jgi:hypothetical protein
MQQRDIRTRTTSADRRAPPLEASRFVVEPVSMVTRIGRWVSYSKCEKTGANDNQTHHDKSKKAGRSKIFAHDDTCALIRQSSCKPD